MKIKNSLQPYITEAKQSFDLSLPLLASNFLRAASGFVGTMMVAHLGKLVLGGLALGASVFFTLVVFFFGMLNAVSVLVSQNYGAKNKDGISSSVSQGFILALIVSVPMYLIVWCSPFIFQFTHEDPTIIHYASIYLRTISLAILPFSFLIVMNQFLLGMSKTRLVLCISLLQVPFEILFTYLFVYGIFGFKGFGIAGVGYAFSIVFSGAAICIGLFICKSKHYSTFKIFSHFGKIQFDYLFELIRVGLPIGCMAVIEVALFGTITFFMGILGNDILAAYQIFNQFLSISFMVVFALSQVTTIRVGQAVGRKDIPSIKKALYVNMVLGGSLVCVIWGIIVAFHNQFMSIDINIYAAKNSVVVYYVIIFFIYGVFDQFFDLLRFVTVGALRGLRDTKIPMILSFISFWVLAFPCAYIFAFTLHLGAYGLLIAMLVGIFSGLTLQLRRFNKLLKRINLPRTY